LAKKAAVSNEGAVIESVAAILEEYANRGIFRGFSRGPVTKGKAVFKMLWHRDRFFILTLDVNKRTMHFPEVLPEVPAASAMNREFQEFVDSRHTGEVPEHRRIDPKKVKIKAGNKKKFTNLTAAVAKDEFGYGTRKLVNLVHEIYLVFLNDGRYYDYMVDVFDLDPDKM
jgi:hypothetical protein